MLTQILAYKTQKSTSPSLAIRTRRPSLPLAISTRVARSLLVAY